MYIYDGGAIVSGSTYANKTDLYNIFATKDNVDNHYRASAATPSMFAGSPMKANVVFSSPLPSTGYSVSITFSSPDARTPQVESRSATGFTINSAHGTIPSDLVYWTATMWK